MIERDLRAAMLLPSAFAFRGCPSFGVGGRLRDLPDIRIANRSPPRDAIERVPRTDAAADARAFGVSRATNCKAGKTGQDERSSQVSGRP